MKDIVKINYKHIKNTYKHITYIGSISCSFLIFILLPYLNHTGSNIHLIIHNLGLLKCFFLYDSSFIEIIHHFLQYYGFKILFNSNIICYNPDSISVLKKIYYILFTSIFNNIKIYVPKQNEKIRSLLDICTFIFFFYYRIQFNYVMWFGDGIIHINNYLLINDNIKNKLLVFISLKIILNIICLMNVYWGYKIINIVKYKITNKHKL